MRQSTPQEALSSSEFGIWLASRRHPEAYNIHRVWEIEGDLDEEALRAAVAEVTGRHRVFGRRLREDGEGPFWAAGEAVPVWSTAGEAPDETAWRAEQGAHRFDLAAECPVRAGLLRRGPQRYLFSLLIHHVACDGLSLEILLAEIAAAYACRTAGGPALPPAADPLPPAPTPSTGYWTEQLAEAEWPGSLPRTPGPRTPEAETTLLPLTAAETELLRTAARSLRATPHMLGLAALYATFAAHGSRRDVMVATPFAGRTPDTAEAVGCLARVVPLRQRWAAGDSGAALVTAVRRTMAKALGRLAEPIREAADLFSAVEPGVTVAFQAHGPLPAPGLAGVEVRALSEDGAGTVRNDLEFDLSLRPDGGELALTRRLAGGTTAEAAARLLADYRATLLRLAGEPGAPLLGSGPLTAIESPTLVRARPAAQAVPVMERFAELVREHPERTAVSCPAGDTGFAELDALVNGLAARLAEHGVAPGDTVGILAERGVALVAAVLAVWRAGGCTVLLDPLHPEDRIAYVLADSGAGIVLRSPSLRGRGTGTARVVELPEGRGTTAPGADAFTAPAPDASRPAYVVHTSGTTGLPKGVLVDHASYAAFTEVFTAGRGAARSGLVSSVSFDLFYLQFLALFTGSCLVVADEDTYRNPQTLVDWVEKQDLRFLGLTPSLFGAMRNFGFEDVLRRGGLTLLLGGEALDEPTWQLLRELGVDGVNAYGPTETTICVTVCAFGERDTPGIGRPLEGVSAYVLGPDLLPVPTGVAGELYVAGPQVARGYLGSPGVTADRFLPDPFSGLPGARMYRTGDRVRRAEDGCLVYLERADHQLKVRGQRVDPVEVENVLRDLPGVRDAYVARRAPGTSNGLLAYVLPDREGPSLDPAGLRTACARRLAPAAVPAHVLVLDSFPLSPGGKLDEQALPAPSPATPAAEAAQDELTRLWQDTAGAAAASDDEDFFACGGSSLDAARLVASVNQAYGAEIDLAVFFAEPTLRGLRHQLETSTGGTEPADGPSHAGASSPATGLSPAQRRLWLMHLLDPKSPEFTVHWAVRLRGALDRDLLAEAWREVVDTHGELRLRVLDGAGEPGRAAWAAEEFALRTRTLPEARLDDELRAAARQVFDIFGEPLAALELISLSDRPDEHVLLLTGHHLVLDRRSVELITEQLYARLDGRPVAAPRRAHRDVPARTPERAESTRAFWTAELAEAAAAPGIDLGGPGTEEHPERVGSVRAALTPADWQRALETARAHRTTPLVLALAAFALTADRHGAAGEVVAGTTMDVRPPGFEDVVGLFVNPVPVRLRVDPELSGGGLLGRAHEALLRSHAHRDMPFDELIRELGLRAEPGRTPLFQALVDHEPAARATAPAGLGVRPVDIPAEVAKYDLEIVLRETGGTAGSGSAAEVEIAFRHSRYSEAQAGRLAAALRDTLVLLTREPDAPARVPVEDGAVLRRPAPLPETYTQVGGLVERIADTDPDRAAVVCGEDRLSYGRLRSGALAAVAALTGAGVAPGDRVAVLAPRSTAMITALLGAHLAGAVAVPLDVDHPDARLRAALADCGATVLLGTAETVARGRSLGLTALDLTALPEPAVPPALPPRGERDAAYMIFTSGSTGRPKGVVVEHGGLAASTAARRAVYPGEPVFLLLSPLAFDSSVAGIWGTLTAGGRLVVAGPDDVRDPARLIGLIEHHAVTDLLCVPSLHGVVLGEARRAGATAALRSLRRAVVAGEPLPEQVMDLHFALLPGVELVNEYGPTEATVWSSYRRYRAPGPIDIGGPVPGYSLYVLDHALRPVPPGVPGELYVGGPGVARGYLGRPADTAAVFLPDPFDGRPGARMYRTGDRVRPTGDGGLAFLGRADDQLKIRGHRIQPGEIETVLREAPGVREAAVVAHGQGRLAAFVTGAADPARVRQEAVDRLPAVMVPGAVHVVERLPLTTNGKVDRRRLAEEADRRVPAAAPGTRVRPEHAEVVEAWREVLGVADVPVDANFFDAGGHSLLMPLLQDALHRRTGVRVPILDLFRHSTVGDMASRLRRTPTGATSGASGASGGSSADAAVPPAPSRRDASRQMRLRRVRPEASREAQEGNR
ncbi:amino acid adenylation domain-containing protein [Streptomyces sp. R44]|uniref:Amino acid adenylation domain-containing protein n=1 Tax=Streptomyces sp. R44 TaxID=3238633 RepID=A0AB39SYK3_9ACTN